MIPLSSVRLLLLFLIALLIFIPLRWDPMPLVQKQLAKVMSQLPAAVSYQHLQWDASGIQLENIQLKFDPALPPLHFSRLRLEPSWLQLAQGNLAFNVTLEADGLSAYVDLALQDPYVELSALQLEVDMAWLQPMLMEGLPVAPQGQVKLHGSSRLLQVNAAEGSVLPLALDLQLQWLQAGVLMGDTAMPLGEYQLSILGVSHSAWTWQLKGGEALVLEGQGDVQAGSAPWMQWPLQGSLHIESAAGSLLASMLGQNRDVVLSGTLLAPHWVY